MKTPRQAIMSGILALGLAPCAANAAYRVDVPCQSVASAVARTQDACDDDSGWVALENGAFIRGIYAPPKIKLIEAAKEGRGQ